MEYQRKKVDKIKTQKPSIKDELNENKLKSPVRLRPNQKTNRDVGFDIEDIPMSPKKSSDILIENKSNEPAHRDIKISRGVNKKLDSTPTENADLRVIIGGKLKIQNSNNRVSAKVGDIILDKLNYYRWNNAVKFLDKYERIKNKL